MGERKPKDYQEPEIQKPTPRKTRGNLKKEVIEPEATETPTAFKKAEPKKLEEISPKTKVPARQKKRSSRYLDKVKLVEKKHEYQLSEAVDLVKKITSSSFEGGIEAHIRLKPNKKGESTEILRGKITFPSGPVKPQRAIKVNPQVIEEIQKGKIDFDILLATPSDLKELAKVAKILGPKGKMPSVKSQTVVADTDKVLREIEKGLVFWKADPQGIIHILIGKINWPNEKIIDNLKALLQTLPKARIISLYLTPSMGPSVKVKLDSL